MPKSRVTARQRTAVTARACACCEYCRAQEQYAPDPFSVEHIVPIAKGGTNALTNLAYSCQGCNGRKYVSIEAIDPATGMTLPLYHPRQHRWEDHFAWNPDCSLIIGLTPIGRATLEMLQLNRVGLVNLRQVLYRFDAHPPEC
ncbi:MAG: HNH endonuclease [Chloroflexota bacterium]|nr:HNH endonuclease [Chloroflexota bacterium]